MKMLLSVVLMLGMFPAAAQDSDSWYLQVQIRELMWVDGIAVFRVNNYPDECSSHQGWFQYRDHTAQPAAMLTMAYARRKSLWIAGSRLDCGKPYTPSLWAVSTARLSETTVRPHLNAASFHKDPQK